VMPMPKSENPEGPASIKVDNIPPDIRRKMWLLKRINAIVGGPTDYKTMVIEALRCLVDSPENTKSSAWPRSFSSRRGRERVRRHEGDE